MKWPWSRPEVRESFTNQSIAHLLSAAAGASDGAALGAVETAARLWGSGLASATVSPTSSALRGVTAGVLDSIGRSLVRRGESLHIVDVRSGRVLLTPCASWNVLGSDDPESWLYQLTLNGPTTSRTITVPAASVVHIRYAPHPSRPWLGRSPVQLASDTARAASLLETATACELEFTQKQMLSPRRSSSDYQPADTLNPETIDKIVKAFSSHLNTGAFVIPADVQAQRLGPEPPDSFPLIRDRLENSLLALHGIPPALVAPRATGTGQRESFRQILHGLLKPLGALLVEELKAKLDPDASLDFSMLRAGDIQGSARAYASLVKAEMKPADAARIVGFEV